MNNNKPDKSILDYLWDWAKSRDRWACLLVSKLCASRSALEDSARDEVLQCFLEDHELEAKTERAIPGHTTVDTYQSASASKALRLLSLESIQGVNRLLPNQKLHFGSALTVIYGDNGSGKSGYARILHSLGCGFTQAEEILSNIDSASPLPQQAILTYEDATGAPNTFNWTPNSRCRDLASIAVFNSACVSAVLGNKHTLLVTPADLELFSLVSAELGKLTDRLSTMANKQRDQAAFPQRYKLRQDGTAFKNVEKLTGLKPLPEAEARELIDKIAVFTANDLRQLEDCQKQRISLNPELLNRQIADSNRSITALEQFFAQIAALQAQDPAGTCKKIAALQKDLADLKTDATAALQQFLPPDASDELKRV